MPKQSRWMSLSQEEKQKILEKQYARKDRTRRGLWKGRPHWTETATPEELEAWKAKVKAGRDKFYASRTEGKGRPKKFNYKKGWNPAKRSAASKAQWVYNKQHRPERLENFIRQGHLTQEKERRRLQPLKDEARWAKEASVKNLVEGEYLQEQKRLYDLAKTVLSESGVEPEPNMPIDYYKEIINFFRPGTV